MNAVKTSWRSRVGDGLVPTPAEVITGRPTGYRAAREPQAQWGTRCTAAVPR